MSLLEKYDTLDNILAHVNELTPRQQELIGDGKTAKHSQFLAQIRTDVPFDIDAMNFAREQASVTYTEPLIEFLKRYEFRSLLPAEATHKAEEFRPETTAKKADEHTMRKILACIEMGEEYSLATK